MTLRAEKLQLTNFRCFRDVALELHPRLTVIVADNGMGKTALLDAIAVGMAEYVDALLGVQTSRGLLASDVRTTAGEGGITQLSMNAMFDGTSAKWSLTRKFGAASMRRGPKQLAAVRAAAARMKARLGAGAETLPVFAFYQSTRFAQTTYFGQKYLGTKQSLDGRLAGFADYFAPLSDPARFNDWYAARWNAVAGHRATGTGEGRELLAQLSSVNQAVETVLKPTGWTSLGWDKVRESAVVKHLTRGELPLSWLSSGIRSMVALTADLAQRCAVINPHLGAEAAARTPGVVLIDEVDLHLHPGWQQRVVELLQIAFADIQFVLSTHSPQVLSTVHKDSVRVVHHDDTESRLGLPALQTRGVESADILAKVMSVDPVPAVPEAQWLSDYRALVQSNSHRSTTGRTLWDRLTNHFGVGHPVLEEIAVLQRLQEFKTEHGLSSDADGGADAHA
jgi:predicted ATP-binding protein involved in virulence